MLAILARHKGYSVPSTMQGNVYLSTASFSPLPALPRDCLHWTLSTGGNGTG